MLNTTTFAAPLLRHRRSYSDRSLPAGSGSPANAAPLAMEDENLATLCQIRPYAATDKQPQQVDHVRAVRLDISPLMMATLFFVQIVLFQEFRPERLGRSGNVWPALRGKIHEIPIRPHRVEMIP
jgi:hypothetical protein